MRRWHWRSIPPVSLAKSCSSPGWRWCSPTSSAVSPPSSGRSEPRLRTSARHAYNRRAPQGGLDTTVEHTVKALLECGPEALRSQKALLRQWEELPLTESVNLSVGVFGQSFLTGEPQRLMQGFLDRKR